ncbi:thiamine pyrophosphate-binding protein [Acidovorax sp. BLS4]|uniref:thiamine pyrophosphate-binding protein n=1 Tax=Acidovorax sp. BLS4 TaxID=3273430 RepID=UPI0029436655|nr:thiamine pyrophosphate-binding protein [Paracidovorax avenae]WOI45588.1 thiamine pyrophosphate-binding protein [Paracidovorax avenae]
MMNRKHIAFQEVDIIDITRPCTKHSFLVKDVGELAGIMKKAFYIARSGRPGPVLVDLPKDVQIAQTEFSYPDTVDIRGYKPNLSGHPRQVEKAAAVRSVTLPPPCPVGCAARRCRTNCKRSAARCLRRIGSVSGQP